MRPLKILRTNPEWDDLIFDPVQRAKLGEEFDRIISYWPFAANSGLIDLPTPIWIYLNVHDAPGYRLLDTGGSVLNVPWPTLTGPTYDRQTADISNPLYRAAWIQMAREALEGGASGLWIDDVNLDVDRSAVRPGGLPPIRDMEWWADSMADFMTQVSAELKAEFPDCEILHNSVWFAGRPDRWADTNIAPIASFGFTSHVESWTSADGTVEISSRATEISQPSGEMAPPIAADVWEGFSGGTANFTTDQSTTPALSFVVNATPGSKAGGVLLESLPASPGATVNIEATMRGTSAGGAKLVVEFFAEPPGSRPSELTPLPGATVELPVELTTAVVDVEMDPFEVPMTARSFALFVRGNGGTVPNAVRLRALSIEQLAPLVPRSGSYFLLATTGGVYYGQGPGSPPVPCEPNTTYTWSLWVGQNPTAQSYVRVGTFRDTIGVDWIDEDSIIPIPVGGPGPWGEETETSGFGWQHVVVTFTTGPEAESCYLAVRADTSDPTYIAVEEVTLTKGTSAAPFGSTGRINPVRRQLAAADFVNIEGGFVDNGLNDGAAEVVAQSSDQWSLRSLFALIETLRELGTNFVAEYWDVGEGWQKYQLAAWLAAGGTSNDGVGLQADRASWPNLWHKWSVDWGTVVSRVDSGPTQPITVELTRGTAQFTPGQNAAPVKVDERPGNWKLG